MAVQQAADGSIGHWEGVGGHRSPGSGRPGMEQIRTLTEWKRNFGRRHDHLRPAAAEPISLAAAAALAALPFGAFALPAALLLGGLEGVGRLVDLGHGREPPSLIDDARAPGGWIRTPPGAGYPPV
jgi:hypothetical protein